VQPSASEILLPECDRRFRSAFAQAAIGVSIVDAGGAYAYANQAFCHISGYEEHELRRLKFSATLHPDDRDSRLKRFHQLVSGQIGSYASERRFIRKDGSPAWVRLSITVPDEEARPSQFIVFMEDITERKRIEDALRASEERFRIAAENASDLIYEWDPQTGAVDLFGSTRQLLGDWPPPETYEAWKKLVHPEDLERVLADGARHIQNGERYSDEYRIIGQNGKVYHYSNRGQAMPANSGEPAKCVGLLTDITESRLAEEAISQLAAIVQSSDSAIIATDAGGRITTWNDGARQLLGYSDAEARALPIAGLFSSTDLAQEILSQIHQGQPSRLDEASFLRKDGSLVPVLLSVSPVRKSNGRHSGSAIIARDISARKKAEKEIAHWALHDHLTGLPNRLSFADGLTESIAGTDLDVSGTAVIFVDLDGFKLVNDTLGHEAGDVLLQQVAQRLSACIRRGDMLARMGGDEFMVLVNGVTEERVALSVAERLGAALRDPFCVAHHELVITASMGISIYPRDGADVSALRRNADAAMYQAKRSGKDRIRFYTPALGAACRSRLELESDLRHALDRQELYLQYQPVFTAADERLTAYEALSRWRHPSRGLVPPSQFIPVAEETGLIIRLGEWVLREACRQCRWWQEHANPLVRVAVNVSALQFARQDFVPTVLSVLRETGINGNLLDLELTESIVMHDIESAIHKMATLREYGIRISVDDFATGYSALAYLVRLPIDILKIDRCFVARIGENDTAVRLIHGMISLAHSIGKRVIVEGIETAAQLEILRELGCDEVQGFLLGRPTGLTRHQKQPQETAAEQLIA
jgi:diguanylate cyclase (GGDEF)-like protein/PAS domain S-box-containing protein